MARPKSIHPKGKTKRIACDVPAPVAERLEREAQKRGVSVAKVIREKLAQVA